MGIPVSVRRLPQVQKSADCSATDTGVVTVAAVHGHPLPWNSTSVSPCICMWYLPKYSGNSEKDETNAAPNRTFAVGDNVMLQRDVIDFCERTTSTSLHNHSRHANQTCLFKTYCLTLTSPYRCICIHATSNTLCSLSLPASQGDGGIFVAGHQRVRGASR